MWGPPLAARRYKDWTSQRAAQGGSPYKIKSANKGNPDKEVFLAGDSRMMRERHAVVSFSYLLYSGDKSISPMKV